MCIFDILWIPELNSVAVKLETEGEWNKLTVTYTVPEIPANMSLWSWWQWPKCVESLLPKGFSWRIHTTRNTSWNWSPCLLVTLWKSYHNPICSRGLPKFIQECRMHGTGNKGWKNILGSQFEADEENKRYIKDNDNSNRTIFPAKTRRPHLTLGIRGHTPINKSHT